MSAPAISPLKAWWLSCRPKTLAAAFSPLFIAVALSKDAPAFAVWKLCLITLTALSLQLACNFTNDYYDFLRGADSPERKGPKRMLQLGILTPRQLQRGSWIAFSCAAGFGLLLILLGGWPIALLLALSLVAAYAYTGGPFPYAYLGLGELMAFLFFGPLLVWGATHLLTGRSSLAALWVGVSPGLLSVALLTVNNFRDLPTDTKTGKKTLAVRLGTYGEKFSKTAYLACLFLAIVLNPLLLAYFFNRPSLVALLVLSPFAFFLVKQFLHRTGSALNACLEATGRLLLVYGVLFFFLY